MDIELLNWIKDGPYRIRVLKVLLKGSKLSSELALSLNINRASMSRILRLLKQRNLVSAVSGNSRTVTYVISEKGREVLADMGLDANEAN